MVIYHSLSQATPTLKIRMSEVSAEDKTHYTSIYLVFIYLVFDSNKL